MSVTREICASCRRESPVGFAVPDEVWAAVTARSPAYRDSVLCIMCFDELAGDLAKWDDRIEFFPVDRISQHAFNRK